jgi:hypothetical protein
VCLDHGKRDPAPRVPYELVPLNHRTGDGQLVELVKMLGRGQVDQSAAQAAAWHLASGLSWQELASKARVKHIGGAQEPLFTAAQLDLARQITEVASRQAEKPAPSTSASGE